MIRYCLDSDVIIDFLRGDKIIVKRIKDILKDSILFITTISLCELFRGAYLTKDPENEIKKIELLAENTLIVTLNKNSAKNFGVKNKELLNANKQVEIIDLMIASICITNELKLITRNKKHFENISELKVEFW